MQYKVISTKSLEITSLSEEEELFFTGTPEQINKKITNKDLQLQVLNEQLRVQGIMLNELITELREKDEQQKASHEMTFTEDAETQHIISLNKYPLERILGYQQGHIIGKDILHIFAECCKEIFEEKRAKGYLLKDFELMLKHIDGREVPCMLTIQHNLETGRNFYTIRDISIERLDEDTQLPLKRSFCSSLEYALPVARRNQENVAILMIDMNGLHEINKTSYDFADKIIFKSAELLKKTFQRETDLVARVNRDMGDEFYVYMPGCGSLENTKRIIQEYTKQVVATDLSLSIGVLYIRWQDIPKKIPDDFIGKQLFNVGKIMQDGKEKIRARVIPENKKTASLHFASGFLFEGEASEQTTIIEP